MEERHKSNINEVLIAIGAIDEKINSIRHETELIRHAFEDHETRIRVLEKTQFTWRGAIGLGVFLICGVFGAIKSIGLKMIN